VISFSGDNAGFVGNIIVKEGTLAGGGNIGGNGIDPPEDTGGGPIEPSGNNAFGLGNATRTITVETGGTLAFRYSGMYTNNYTISDYCATQIPTINVDGGTLAVQPIVAEKTDETTVPSTYYYAYHEERATVNNVTLNNGLMTSQTGTTIGSNPGTYAWFVNGTLTSKGESTINCSLSATPVSPGAPARTVIDALVALQSGDMANPKTTFDVQNGTLSVYSTLTDGLNSTAHATAPGAPHATGLTKTGAGTMSILGNLTYTGNTDIQNGTLEIATATPITLNTVTGASSAGTLKVCDGATLTATSIQVDTLVIGGLATAASSASVAAVPEPGTLVMLVLAAAALAGVCIRRK
jgi:autotransporter-associated beta strand protein